MANIKVRVGQQNTVKVVSSLSGASSSQTTTAENVIGGIGSITELYVSGISTFGGVSTFEDDVYFNSNIIFDSPLSFESFTATFADITGIATIYNLDVSGIATLGGAVVTGELTVFNAEINGITTVNGDLKFAPGNYSNYGIPYFESDGNIVSTTSPGSGIDYTNYILTTNNSEIPVWSNAIDGGTY